MARQQVGAISLYYERHGEGPAPPLLLLMGLGADASAWLRQLPALTRGREVITLDNRGVGRSDHPPGPYTTGQMAADTLGLLDALGLPAAHVLGISMGGMIAQELALAAPGRVRSLLLCVTTAGADAGMVAVREAGLSVLSGGAGTLDEVLRFMAPLVFGEAFLRDEGALLAALATDAAAHGWSMQGFLGQLAAVSTHDAAPRLAELDRPTLVIGATADRLVPFSHSERLARLIPRARLLPLEGASHGLQLEQADRFNDAVLAWIAERDRADAGRAQPLP